MVFDVAEYLTDMSYIGTEGFVFVETESGT